MGKKSGIRFLPFPNVQTAVWWKEPWIWSWKGLEWSSWLCTCRRHCRRRECGPRSAHPVGECPPEPQARPLQHLLCWCSQLPLPAESSPDSQPRFSALPSLNALCLPSSTVRLRPAAPSRLCPLPWNLPPVSFLQTMKHPLPPQSSRPLQMAPPLRSWPFPVAGILLTPSGSPASCLCFSGT